MTSAIFYMRDLQTRAWLPTFITMRVVNYSWATIGGPLAAELEATGPNRMELEALLDWTRYSVVIVSDLGDPVWWGYVSRVELPGAMTLSADVELMANKVAVAYTTVAQGQASTGSRGTTSWNTDAQSIAEFGTKEVLLSLSGVNSTAAAARRDVWLKRVRYPGGGVQITPNTSGQNTAKITCNGWWSTLGWRYATVPVLLALAFETLGTTNQSFGNTTVTRLAQAFDISSAVNLQAMDIYIRKVGTPADNVKVSINVNPDDAHPGAELASQTIAGGSIQTSYTWVDLVLGSAYGLTAGSTYFLTLARTGSQDAANYYQVLLDEHQGYSAGPMVKESSGSWTNLADDMPFRLYNNALVETVQQVQSLMTNFGQFLRRVQSVTSGISSESYRNGDADAKTEVEALLLCGNVSGSRLIARVDVDRNVTVSVETLPPSAGGAYLTLDQQGHLFNGLARVREETCPVGWWVKAREILAPGMAAVRLSWNDAFLIEESTWDVETKTLTFRPSTEWDNFDFGNIDG